MGGEAMGMDLPFLKRRAKEINKVILLPVDEISPNPNQPRKYFDKNALEELCQSILANGLLQPVTVRQREGGEYELIAGERRWLAFRQLGQAHIPSIVEECTDQQSSMLALIENLQRKDLNYFEEAAAIQRLMKDLDLNQQQISLKIGKAQSTVANKLRLLRFPPPLRELMLEAGLTERHARAVLKLPEGEAPRHIEHIIQNKLNVEQAERYIQECLHKLEQTHPPTRLLIIKDMRIFLNSINKAVKLMQSAGIEVDSQKKETDEYVEMTIRIPKASVYRTREAVL